MQRIIAVLNLDFWSENLGWNFDQKWNSWSNINSWVRNRDFDQTNFGQKSKFQ